MMIQCEAIPATAVEGKTSSNGWQALPVQQDLTW